MGLGILGALFLSYKRIEGMWFCVFANMSWIVGGSLMMLMGKPEGRPIVIQAIVFGIISVNGVIQWKKKENKTF